MPTPIELLSVIQTALDKIQQSEDAFSASQQPFVQHLARTTRELRVKIDPMPQTDMALRRLIPRFGDELIQRIAALFGYAKLLLDSPQSFDNATLTSEQETHLQTIYQHGKYLYDLIEAIQKSAHAERVANHKAPAEAIPLIDFLESQHPILTYLLRDKPIQLTFAKLEHETILASPYHLAALLDHLVTTLANECDMQGSMTIKCEAHPKYDTYEITLLCSGLIADDALWDTLFAKNGRDLYLKRLHQYDGEVAMRSITGSSTAFVITLHRTIRPPDNI